MKSLILIIGSLFTVFSCKTRETSIEYYNKVNAIDSIFRFENNGLEAAKMYHKLFKNYPPHNNEHIREYQNFIELADLNQLNFGEKKSLIKLIPLTAPNWKYNKFDNKLIGLYRKYGIDSIELEKEIRIWDNRLNKQLVDSFSLALKRDQAEGRRNKITRALNDKINENLNVWTFDKFGYPSQQKIGLWGNNGTFLNMLVLFNHAADASQFEYIKHKLFEYVKNGECPPKVYAELIDKRQGMMGDKSLYGELNFSEEPLDTISIDRNRKKIGLPTLRHQKMLFDEAKK